jgi:hypothetical protein
MTAASGNGCGYELRANGSALPKRIRGLAVREAATFDSGVCSEGRIQINGSAIRSRGIEADELAIPNIVTGAVSVGGCIRPRLKETVGNLDAA